MYKKIFLIFTAWRLFLFFIAFLAPNFIHQFGNKFPYVGLLESSNLPHFLWSFGNFDGVHYLGIASHLYDFQYTQAFFPLYPLLIRFLSPVFMGNILLTGLIISNTFFLLGLFVFYKLVSESSNEKTAFWSALFILAFPTSFYFGSVYTEGLFFFLLTSSFYLYSKNKIFLASVVGAFSSATRLIGVFMLPALIKRKAVIRQAVLLLIPSGLSLYMAYLYIKFHNAFYFLTAQTIFGQERSTSKIILLPQVFFRYIKILLTTRGEVLAISSLEISSTIFAFLILALASKKMKADWLIFSWLAVLVPTLTGTLASMPRYVLIAFPIFIYLGMINNLYIKLTVLTLFLILLTITTAFFTQGYWVA